MEVTQRHVIVEMGAQNWWKGREALKQCSASEQLRYRVCWNKSWDKTSCQGVEGVEAGGSKQQGYDCKQNEKSKYRSKT